MTITKCGDWITARAGDEIVMMSVDVGHYIGLNPVGARIWDLLDTPQSASALCERLMEDFEIGPETCRKEVDDFLATLESYHAIRVDR